MTSSSAAPKLPRLIFDPAEPAIYAFPPNRETLGGTAYLLTDPTGNILIDTPAWTEENQIFLRDQTVKWLLITHRGGIGKQLIKLQQTLQCQVLIQEQEAYLIPEVETTTFHHSHSLNEHTTAIWTPGHSPGSSCLYSHVHGGILFSGRHLLPDRQAQPLPLRTAKTFHWPRQLKAIAALQERFMPETLHHICPGASIGFLRGASTIDDAYNKLMQIDLAPLAETQALM
ncbi:MBL fold metallo-hydrolase [filamentous cyanobacterium LEGE 11480]|uniref:MBL fold metallo-hydrolase n=1 Tax=Romeriopsis navalis LEGE 11480 TaxID=2777977 RepID=A0A928Z5B8_9CYAN|nr:MBL fold metallo-hydrolase [Romeriopsis navalis]MBE9031308.1 MBL fold metallo-hydrolase [Romeriopsis navalis LEGE 11480]